MNCGLLTIEVEGEGNNLIRRVEKIWKGRKIL